MMSQFEQAYRNALKNPDSAVVSDTGARGSRQPTGTQNAATGVSAAQGASEHDEQSAVVAWARAMEAQEPRLWYLFAIPNGGHRHKATAIRLKREGVRAGIPDLALMYPMNGQHGLFVEMKVGSNTTTESQDRWLVALKRAGYATAVCYSADAAIDVIKSYLEVDA